MWMLYSNFDFQFEKALQHYKESISLLVITLILIVIASVTLGNFWLLLITLPLFSFYFTCEYLFASIVKFVKNGLHKLRK